MTHYVYAIQPIGMDIVKIGYTRNIDARTKQLASFSPVQMQMRHLRVFTSENEARATEKRILSTIVNCGGHGEWRNDLTAIDDVFRGIGGEITMSQVGVGMGLIQMTGLKKAKSSIQIIRNKRQPKASKGNYDMKKWLKSNGYKSLWVATQLGVSDATLSRWIRGHAVPIPAFRAAIDTLTDGAVKAGDWE